ncbi:MAG: endo-1,4-beta-xylanase [Pirellulaceae bacterium]|nr:endo-1,4-beta-xylanase [Pirellulaceae bacterium]
MLAFVSLVAGLLLSADPLDSLPPGTSVLTERPLESMRASVQESFGTIERHNVDDGPDQEVIRADVVKRPQKPYDVQIRFPTDRTVAKGEVLLVRFSARAVARSPETDEAVLTVVFEQAGPPHRKSLSRTLEIPKDWQRFDLPFRADETLEIGRAQLGFQLGYDPQTIEIGGIQLLSFGPEMDLASLPTTRSTYEGQSPDAAWRAAAAQRIEEHRKGDLIVTVLDPSGSPVPGAQVEINMLRHAFAWGSAVTAELLTADTDDARKYRETVAKLFNRVVFENDLKWPNWERTEQRQTLMDATVWLEDAGIEIRGHCLVWPSWRYLPKEVASLADNPAALRERVNGHVTEEASALRGRLAEWDVINEPYTNHDLMDVLGNEAMVEWFRLARQADPEVRLFINDYGILSARGRDAAHQDHYERTIRFLLEQQAPLEGIGLQSHFGDDLTPPPRLVQVLDRFAQFGLPLLITEHDINIADEALQAEYTRDFLTAVFSHPAVAGVLTWGFWEGRHWRPQGAYFRRDWSVRPAGQVWLDLVHDQWWTRDSGATDASGQRKIRGFLGRYEVTATAEGRSVRDTVTITREGSRLTLTLAEPSR